MHSAFAKEEQIGMGNRVISYNGLWKLLIDKNLQRKDLEKTLKISPSTIAKMGRGELVAMSVLYRICEHLDCNIGDVVSFEKKNNLD